MQFRVYSLSSAVPSIFVSGINRVILNGSLALTCQTKCAPTSTLLGTQATYHAILNKTSGLLTAGEIMNHIKDWRESDGTLLYQFIRVKLAKKKRLHSHSRFI